VPEVPVMVMVDDPAVAVAAAVKVSTLVEVAGLVANAAVTPVGNPDAAKVTLPVNPPWSATVMVLVPVLPAATVRFAGDAESVKSGVAAVNVRTMVVVAVNVPEVPVMVTVDAPAVAALVAVSVSTVELAEEAGLNEAVTPLGRPDAANETLPVNGLTSVIVIVSVPLAPWAIDRLAADGLREKLPTAPLPPQVVPLIANEVGIALVTPFHVPLNPMPVRLPPAGMLPL